jgi:hypothetical protein
MTVYYYHEEYTDFVCMACDEEQARCLHPNRKTVLDMKNPFSIDIWNNQCGWIKHNQLDSLVVQRLGTAAPEYKEPCVYCYCYNGDLM